MLHRSFKPAKCKTALKLVMSRIKLLKNKREAQIKQMKRDLANLLETGQDRTAMIRVEHVVREEKMMAAYDLIEIYCELIVARLPMIESQKHCPIDLKEPVTSVVFAAPRCADIPELLDIQKHFTAKYGKEFVNAAVELRPDCGVGRMLIEKLSVRAPDGPTKIKILKAIAEEQNVSWDPESIEEKEANPPQDLLNGPSTFAKSSEMSYETPNSQSSLNYAPKHDEYVHHDSREQNETSSPRMRTPGTRPDRAEFRHSYSENETPYSAGRENWPLEFKDATSAARAAAESAERASMAARAAAELATGERFRRESPSHEPPLVHILRNESSGKYSGSKMHRDDGNAEKGTYSASNRSSELPDYRLYTDSENEKIHRDLRTHIEKVNENQPETPTIADENSHSQGNAERSDAHYQKTSSGVSSIGMKEQSSDSDDEFMGKMHEGAETDDIEYISEEKLEKKSSLLSSHSGSKNFEDDHDDVQHLNHNIFGDHSGQEPTVGRHQENVYTNSNPFNSYSSNVVFDESDSEEECKLDTGGEYKGQASNLFASPSRGPTNFQMKDNSQNTGQTLSDPPGVPSSQSHFARDEHDQPSSGTTSKIVAPSEPNELPPVAFDDSDGGPSSGSEEELEKPKLPLFSKPQISPDHSKSQIDSGNNDKKVLNSAFREQSSHQSLQHSKETLIHEVKDSFPTKESRNAVKSDEFLDQSSSESGKELNFGTLSGGFRNRGSRRPPYTKNASSVIASSQSKQAAETHSTMAEQTYFPPTPEKSTGTGSYHTKLGTKTDKTDSRSFVTDYDSDSSDLEEEPPLRILRNSQPTHSQKIATPVTVIDRPSPQSHGSFFDEEDNATVSSARKSPPVASRSRRTKVTQYGSQANQRWDTSSAEGAHLTSLPEPKASLHEEVTRPSAGRKTYRTPSQTVSSITETVNPSRSHAEPPSRESSRKQASHVHPKLPDFEELTAHLNSLRKNRE